MVHDVLPQWLNEGAKIHKTKITTEFDYTAYQQHQGANAIPLFIVSETGELTPVTTDTPPCAAAGAGHYRAVAAAQQARSSGSPGRRTGFGYSIRPNRSAL